MQTRFLAGFLSIILISCGRESKPDHHASPNPPPSFSLTVDSTADLPPCTEVNARQLVYSVAERQLMHCQDNSWKVIAIAERGEAGPKGEQGPKGERGEAVIAGGYGLYDVDDHLIGYPDSPSISPDSDRYVMFVDGLVGQIRPSTGQIMLGDSSCYYETADCSKTCYSLNGPADPLGNHLLERNSDKRLVYVPNNAKTEGELHYDSRWSGGVCEAIKGFWPRRFSTAEWQPSGLTVPLRLPLKVRLLH